MTVSWMEEIRQPLEDRAYVAMHTLLGPRIRPISLSDLAVRLGVTGGGLWAALLPDSRFVCFVDSSRLTARHWLQLTNQLEKVQHDRKGRLYSEKCKKNGGGARKREYEKRKGAS